MNCPDQITLQACILFKVHISTNHRDERNLASVVGGFPPGLHDGGMVITPKRYKAFNT